MDIIIQEKEELKSYQIKLLYDLQKRFKDSKIEVSKNDRILIDGKVIKGAIISEYMQKTHKINLDFICNKIETKSFENI